MIRERRETLGLEQAELAASLGVRQQAVSGWERGKSRPRRAMLADVARVLATDESKLVEAGAYLPPKSAIRRPVRPLTRLLPLDELPEERFEDLIAEVMGAMHPDGHASRFGGRGHKQYGIDILITADGESLATGQCKRHKEFGPTAVREAISQVTMKAGKHHLFLSRMTATPRARTEAARHKGWELWDGEDISRFIRQLPRDKAVRLVDTYFPGHREEFLGVASPGPWLHPEEHFDLSRSVIFNHEWDLAGRAAELDSLTAAAYGTAASLSIVMGHGGAGKTRLLKALVDAAPGPSIQIRVLSGDTPITATDFELLPAEGHLVVIVDDVHEIADIVPVVGGIWRRHPRAHVVLATRPYGHPRLSETLARAGLLLDDRTEIKLQDLESEDAEKLAREALGDDAPEGVVHRLARLTIDSPLATVVGGVLISRGELDPAALEQDANVRDQIMRGFRDALIRDPLVDDPPTRTAVLDALAATQPFRGNDPSSRDSLSAIVGKPYDILHKHLRSLESAGILRRRGDSLRIVPDLLGDVILADAAFGDDPIGTEYLARIEPLVNGVAAEHLFVNVSRVDWQVRQRRDGTPSLAASLWTAFRERVERADLIDRRELARLLAKVAYFQPRRTLHLTRWLIDNPTSHISDDHAIWSVFTTPTYVDVLHELPPALKLVAMNFETLPDALTQLWELAQSDQRPTNPHPEHALRVLRDIAEFDLGKPLGYNAAVIDTVETWFADGLIVSPFEVLEPMLATEGDDSTMRNHTITFKPYAFNASSVMPIRQRIIDLALREIASADLRRAAAAANALSSALRYPTGTFGREVTADERAAWTPGFVDTIQRLGAISASAQLDPAILVAIRRALHWHESYSSTDTHNAAVAAVRGLPSGIGPLLALTMHDGWGNLIRDSGDSFEDMEAKRLQLGQDVVRGVATLSNQEVVDLVVDRLQADIEAFGPGSGHPGPVVATLIEARPGLANGLLEHFRSATEPTALESVLPVVLATFAGTEPSAALEIARELLESDSGTRRRGVVQALSWNRGTRDPSYEELALLRQLATDPDPIIRRGVVRAAQILARTHEVEATKLLAAVRFGDDPQLADEFFMSLSKQLGLTWDHFSEEDLVRIRKDLLILDDIGEYSIARALAKRSADDPEWVIGLLKDRIEFAEGLDSLGEYRPMPFSWGSSLRIRDTAQFVPALQSVLSWIASNTESWIRQGYGADVFATVASSYDKSVLAVLRTALTTGDKNTVRAVAAVLRKAPRTFIWDEPDFVTAALHGADRHGEEVRRQVATALWGATISGGRTGTPGQPFPQDIEQRDKSRELAKTLPAGSLEEKFYSDMARNADDNIAREIADDVPDDGREW